MPSLRIYYCCYYCLIFLGQFLLALKPCLSFLITTTTATKHDVSNKKYNHNHNHNISYVSANKYNKCMFGLLRQIHHHPKVRFGSAYSTSIKMSMPKDHQEYTLSGLTKYAQEVVRGNLNKPPNSRISVCVVIAGGGGTSISTLASTPGASSMLLEGTVTYDRKSYQNYVNLPSGTPSFSYASHQAAKLASEAALQRALKYRSTNLRVMNDCIGVACASALKSSSPDSGYGHIVATRADGQSYSLDVTLASTHETDSPRSRMDEDIFLSHLILRSIENVQKQNQDCTTTPTTTTTNLGDVIVETFHQQDHTDDVLSAAKKIVNGQESVILLLPTYDENETENDNDNTNGRNINNGFPKKPTSLRSVWAPVIPHGSLVFPGSFNPPHDGHISLARAAVDASMKKLANVRRASEPPILFELSLVNADKAPASPDIVCNRIHQFLDLDNLPHQWGLLLTSAPLFSDKASCFNKVITKDPDSVLPKISFVIGTDTMVRIINPKYYGNEQTAMLEALRSMENIHFVVGGRLEQSKDTNSSSTLNGDDEDNPRFISGHDELSTLPSDVQRMFTIVQEKDFRVDVSSSEIREQLEQQHQVNGKVDA